MSKSIFKLFGRTLRKFIIIFILLFYTTIFLYTFTLIPSATATISVLAAPSDSKEENIIESNATNQTIRLPSDKYLITNQRECFKSRRFFSCLKYRASKFIWSLATNQFNYFDSSNSRALVDVNQNDDDYENDYDDDDDDDYYDGYKGKKNKKLLQNTTTINKRNIQMKFVYLNTPSDLEIFEETRTFQGDGEISKAIKFVKRAVQTFAQHHGLQVHLNSLGGLQVSSGGKNFITGRGPHKEMKKRLKFAILLPIIILVKLFHLKMTVIPLLFLMNGLNLLLIAGGTYILYYLKHHTICKIKPHVMESHSHVWDHIPSEFRGHKKTRKKLKWLILFPLIILGKIASLKMSMVVLMFTVIGAQLALAGGFAFIIYWLKHTYLCKINPKYAETVSGGPTWEQDGSDYSSLAYPGVEPNSPYIGSKDWASSKAYNAYNYLDTISRPI